MLEKQEKIKLRLGMFQHIHFQKKPVKRQQKFKCRNNKQLLDKAKYQNTICLYSQQNNSTSSPGLLG